MAAGNVQVAKALPIDRQIASEAPFEVGNVRVEATVSISMEEELVATYQIDRDSHFGRKGLRDALVDSDPLKLVMEILADGR